jgi:hypothetical protein
MKSIIITRTITNQKARIRITIIIAITTNKPNASSIYLEPDLQPNPLISILAAYTEYISLSLGHETSIDSAKVLSSYINNSTSNLQ